MNRTNSEKKLSSKESNKTTSEWIKIIENTPEKELRKFLLAYANKNRGFQDDLIINLSKSRKEISIDKYQNIIARTFKSMAGRHGFIEYRDAYAAMQPVHDLLEKVEEYIAKGNSHEAFSIAAAVAPVCLDTLEYMDDSNGECGGAINEAFCTVDKILNSCTDTQLSDFIFDWLLEQVQNTDYDNYGCADELEPIFFHQANNKHRLQKAYQFIEYQLKKHKNSDVWSSKYSFTKYSKHKIELLDKEGKQAEAEKIIDDNINISDFREIRIKQAIEKNDYQTAIAHIEKGVDDAIKDNLLGIVHRLKQQLLDIYKNQKDQNNIRKLSKELFFDNSHSIGYYRVYKQTFKTVEWDKERENIIEKMVKNRVKTYWGFNFQSGLANVYIEEKMWDRLLKEVTQANRIEITDQYSKYLKNDYPDELILLYKNSLIKYAEKTGRNIYTDIVRYLKNMAQLKGGKDIAQKLMHDLLETYNNRPAMKDEFRELKW